MAELEQQIKDYAKLRFEETKRYLYTELELLEIVEDYPTIKKLLAQLPGRLRLFIKNKTTDISEDVAEVFPEEKREQFRKIKSEYLTLTSKEIMRLSMIYIGSDGRFEEAVGYTLEKLSKEFNPDKPSLENMVLGMLCIKKKPTSESYIKQ